MGLAVGFVLKTDDIINGTTSKSLYDEEYHENVIKVICSNSKPLDKKLE